MRSKSLKKVMHGLLLAGSLLLGVSCTKSDDEVVLKSDEKVKIAVISDIHVMPMSLLINDGAAFQTYLAGDRKMLVQSEAILKKVIQELLAEKPNVVLVTGDLTKDGEKVSHQMVASYLKQLTDAGIKVMVTPGNHDINNPHAMSFDGATSTKVASVTPDEFKTIYGSFGYDAAIAKDAGSLSYVAEPYPGLRILSIDACEYYNNTDKEPITAGTIKPATLTWALAQIKEAKEKGKVIVGMMHHGIVPHYASQTTFFPEYVVDNWQDASAKLSAAGLPVMFTGHYHSHDISMTGTAGSSFLYDVETGSTVTYPSPYRVITIQDGKMAITSRQVTSIESSTLNGQDFQTFAKNFLENGLDQLAVYMLTNPPYSLPKATATVVAPVIRNAFVAHYSGDEKITAADKAAVDQVVAAAGNFGATLNALLMGLWTDTAPADKNVTIDLKTGEIVK